MTNQRFPHARGWKNACLALAASAFVAGCGGQDRLTDAEHLAKARELHAKKDDKAAIVEARNAIQKNAKNAAARILLAEIYLDMGSGKQAQTELEIAQQRGAPATALKLPMARAYLLQSNFDQAAQVANVTLSTPAADRAQLMEVQGEARLGMRQFQPACALFDEARNADPKLIKAYTNAAMCVSAFGDIPKAREILDGALKIEPNNAGIYVMFGDIDRLERKLDDAIASYTKALSINATNAEALLGRALSYADANRLKEAEGDLAKLTTAYRGHPLTSFVTGIIRFREGRYPEAKVAFETTLTTAPAHFPSILWLGLTNYQQGNFALAATELNQYTALVPGSPKARALLALARAKAGQPDASVDLAALGKMDLKDPQTLAMLGETYTYLGNTATGAQYLTRSVQLQPESDAARLTLAVALTKQKDFDGAVAQLREVLKRDPNSAPASELLVQSLVEKKDYAGAMAEAQAFRKRDPASPVAGNAIGSLYLLTGDKAAARAAFEEVTRTSPTFFPAWNNLALMDVKENRLDAAADRYRQALRATPDLLPALLALHSVARAQGHYDEAQKTLQQAVRSHPNEVAPALMLAQSYLSANLPRKAIDATDAAARANPDDPGLLEVRGLAYIALNEPAGAIVPLNRLTKIRPKSADAFVYVSAAQVALGEKAAALASLKTALKLDPNHYGARLANARLAVIDGRFDEALTTAKALEKEKPTDPAPVLLEANALSASKRTADAQRLLADAVQRFPKSREARLALVRSYASSGDHASMQRVLADWRQSQPDDPVAHDASAEAALNAGRTDEAIAEYRAVLKLQPDNGRALNNLGFLLIQRSPAEALEFAKRATDLDPSNANAFDTLGQVEAARGAYPDALKAFKRATELAPKDPGIRYHQAVVLAQSGDRQLARRELERLLAANPTFKDAGEARTLMNQLPRS